MRAKEGLKQNAFIPNQVNMQHFHLFYTLVTIQTNNADLTVARAAGRLKNARVFKNYYRDSLRPMDPTIIRNGI